MVAVVVSIGGLFLDMADVLALGLPVEVLLVAVSLIAALALGGILADIGRRLKRVESGRPVDRRRKVAHMQVHCERLLRNLKTARESGNRRSASKATAEGVSFLNRASVFLEKHHPAQWAELERGAEQRLGMPMKDDERTVQELMATVAALDGVADSFHAHGDPLP